MNASQIALRESIPVKEYIQRSLAPVSHVAHGWELHSAVLLTRAEERSMVREPAEAVPESVARRLGKLRVLLVPFIACLETGDVVAFTDPAGEKHSAVWVESGPRIDLVLACRDCDAHDTGFEFLASVAELLRSRLTLDEKDRYGKLLKEELEASVNGEIDQDAHEAKQSLRNRRMRAGAPFNKYRDASFTSTGAEYMHGLWHDVQIHVGPEHLPVSALRKRMILMAEMFPPNSGYRLFAEGDEE